MNDWFQPLIGPFIASLVGTGLVSYVAIKVLQIQMGDVKDWIKELRKRSHDTHNAVLRQEGKYMMLDERVKRLEEK